MIREIIHDPLFLSGKSEKRVNYLLKDGFTTDDIYKYGVAFSGIRVEITV